MEHERKIVIGTLALGCILGIVLWVTASGVAPTPMWTRTAEALPPGESVTDAKREAPGPPRIPTDPFDPGVEPAPRLTPRTRVTGLVRDVDGSLAVGARVGLSHSIMKEGEESVAEWTEVRADTEGRYRFSATPGWRVRLWADSSSSIVTLLPAFEVQPGMNQLEAIHLCAGTIPATMCEAALIGGTPLMRRPWLIALVAGLAGLALGFLIASIVAAPVETRIATDAPVLPAPSGAAEETRANALTAPARIDTAPFPADRLAGATAGALRDLGVIRGRVTGVEPAVRHSISVMFIVDPTPEEQDARGRPIRGLIPNDRSVPEGIVDGEGHFEIRGLGACSGELLVSQLLEFSPTRVYDSARLGGLRIAPGEVLDGIEIPMSPAPAVDGRVVDEDGHGVSGVVIEVDENCPIAYALHLTVSTDADGRFHFPGVPRVPLRVQVQDTPGLICRPLSGFVPGSGEAIVHLSRPATLEGSIPEHLLADGRVIHLEPLDDLGMISSSQARPQFSCTGLWPGRYRIQILDEEGQIIEEIGTVLLRPGETTQLP